MKVAIIGAGPVGVSFGKALLKAGHEVMFSSRTPTAPDMQALSGETGAPVGTVAETLAFSDVVAFALRWEAIQDVAGQLPDWSQKVIIDLSNRFGPPPPDSTGTVAGDIARMTGAKVIKAFNTIGAEHYQDPLFNGARAAMLVAGDDITAKGLVMGLAEALGFEPIDAGPLSAVHILDKMAEIWVHLAIRTPLGRNIAFALIRK